MSFFDSNTNAPKITYKDELETIPNLLTIPVDADGNLPNIWFSGSASVIYLDQFNVQYAARNPVGEEIGIGNFTAWSNVVSYSINDIVLGSDGDFYKSLVNGNQDNDPTAPSLADWEQIRFIGVWNTNITYTIGDVTQTANGDLWKALTATAGNDPTTDDGTNWAVAFNGQWINKSAAFTIFAGKSYQMDNSGGAMIPVFKATYAVGDPITLHNESVSTGNISITNSALTIKGPNGTIAAGTPLELEPGNSVQLVAKTTTILEVVGAQV